MASLNASMVDIVHGPVLHHAPHLYGRPPKAGSQADSLSFHLVYDDIPVPMRDGVELIGDLYIPAINTMIDSTRRWPCVLIRTPYDKNKVNPDLRNPGVYWTQNGYCCFIQDCRGRFKSGGNFYKYTGEAEDGYDTVEWLAQQSWCNANIVTEGPSYLAHVQTSMAMLRPPHLKAIFCNKGGFWNAHTSGVRNGGAYEARQWVWAIKNSRTVAKEPHLKEALSETSTAFDGWLKRYPYVRGCSPLSLAPEYESFIFDQVENANYNDYWKQVGLNTEEHIDEFADIPCLFFSGWYDIYCRSTIDFFVHLSKVKKSPMLLIMGPWQHVGAEGHVAGEVDFGVNALVTGNLAPNMFSLSRRWFDRWVEPATQGQPRKLTPEEKLQAAIRAAEQQFTQSQSSPSPSSQSHSPSMSRDSDSSDSLTSMSGQFNAALPSPSSIVVTHHPRGPYTSLSHFTPTSTTHAQSSSQSQPLSQLSHLGPTIYIPPSTLPREKPEPQVALPPPVRYFRMGGGDGHKTSQDKMFHGGVWMQATNWPPPGTKTHHFFLGRRSLSADRYFESRTKSSQSSNGMRRERNEGGERGRIGERHRSEGEDDDDASSIQSLLTHAHSPSFPDLSLLRSLDHSTTFPFDPRNPCPSIGGNLFSHGQILLSGAYNQCERRDMFLCQPPYLPLASRRDVCVYRTEPLTQRLDVTGMPVCHLFISSSAVDTDFTVKLIDEYPPSSDYPTGFAMQITHGIKRVRYRESREYPVWMTPGKVYRVTVEMYPTSNLFNVGHCLRLDVSSSNFPHFDINMNTDEEFESKRYVIAENTVYHCRQYPSVLELPVQTRSGMLSSGPMEEALS